MKTFKEFINENESPYDAFLKMRQGVFGNSSDVVKKTRNPAEVQMSHEVQSGHKVGAAVPQQVIKRLVDNNPDDLRSFISPDTLRAGQAYPFIQKRIGGRNVSGVINYNPMFPLQNLLRILNLD